MASRAEIETKTKATMGLHTIMTGGQHAATNHFRKQWLGLPSSEVTHLHCRQDKPRHVQITMYACSAGVLQTHLEASLTNLHAIRHELHRQLTSNTTIVLNIISVYSIWAFIECDMLQHYAQPTHTELQLKHWTDSLSRFWRSRGANSCYVASFCE